MLFQYVMFFMLSPFFFCILDAYTWHNFFFLFLKKMHMCHYFCNTCPFTVTKPRVSAIRRAADKFYHTEPLPSFIRSYRSYRPRPRCTVRKNGRVNLQHMRKFRTSDARGRMVRANAVASRLRRDFASRKGATARQREGRDRALPRNDSPYRSYGRIAERHLINAL